MRRLLYCAGYRYLERLENGIIRAYNGEPPYPQGNGNWVKPAIVWDYIEHEIKTGDIQLHTSLEVLSKPLDCDITEELNSFGYKYVARDRENGLYAYKSKPIYDEAEGSFYAPQGEEVLELHTSHFLKVRLAECIQIGDER